jgi:hypothetical protein
MGTRRGTLINRASGTGVDRPFTSSSSSRHCRRNPCVQAVAHSAAKHRPKILSPLPSVADCVPATPSTRHSASHAQHNPSELQIQSFSPSRNGGHCTSNPRSTDGVVILDSDQGEDPSSSEPRASEVQGGGGVEGAYEQSLPNGG